MNLRSLALAVVAGLASFLVVGLAVTAVTERWIEFSLFVGLPAGLVAGAVVAAAVYLGIATTGPPNADASQPVSGSSTSGS